MRVKGLGGHLKSTDAADEGVGGALLADGRSKFKFCLQRLT
jgi:hypothetical protein